MWLSRHRKIPDGRQPLHESHLFIVEAHAQCTLLVECAEFCWITHQQNGDAARVDKPLEIKKGSEEGSVAPFHVPQGRDQMFQRNLIVHMSDPHPSRDLLEPLFRPERKRKYRDMCGVHHGDPEHVDALQPEGRGTACASQLDMMYYLSLIWIPVLLCWRERQLC